MNMMKKFTTLTVCAAFVPALALSTNAFAQTQNNMIPQCSEVDSTLSRQGNQTPTNARQGNAGPGTIGPGTTGQGTTGQGTRGQGTTNTTGQSTTGQGSMSYNNQRGYADGFFSDRPDNSLYADDMIGKTIKHRGTSENVGDIQDLVIGNDGRITGVLVKTGGFWGMGGQEVNMSWDNLHHCMNDGEHEFYTHATEDSLRNAPKYNR